MTLLSRHNVILSLLVLQAGIITNTNAKSQCYYLNGTATDETYQPCFPDKPNSACCVTNKPNDAPNDICLDNGLCYSQDTGYSGLIFQDACTDQDWRSAECPRFCNSLEKTNTGYFMLPCPAKGGGQWCCSQSGEDCCDSASSVSMPALSTSTSTSSSSTSPTTATAAPTNTGGGEEGSDSQITSVGAGVGVSLGACLLGAIAGLVFQHYIHKRRLQGLQEELALRMAAAEPMQYGQTSTVQPPLELENTQKPRLFELGSQRH